jgi:hypothetical protein
MLAYPNEETALMCARSALRLFLDSPHAKSHTG